MSQIDCIKHDCQNGRHNSCDGCNVYELHKVIFQSGNYCNSDIEDLIDLLKDKKKSIGLSKNSRRNVMNLQIGIEPTINKEVAELALATLNIYFTQNDMECLESHTTPEGHLKYEFKMRGIDNDRL